MKLNIKKIAIISLIMILIGTSLSCIGYTLGAMDFINNTDLSKYGIGSKASQEIVVKELGDFKKIEIDLKELNITVRKTDKKNAYIEYYKYHSESEFVKSKENSSTILLEENVVDETNSVRRINPWINIERFSINLGEEAKGVTLFIPKDKEPENISIKNESGQTELSGIKSKNLYFRSTDGDIDLFQTDIVKSDISTDSGNINVRVSKILGNDTSLDVRNNSGDISINNLSDKDSTSIDSEDDNTKFYYKAQKEKNKMKIFTANGSICIDTYLISKI